MCLRPRESTEREPIKHTSSHIIVLKKHDEARQLFSQSVKTSMASNDFITLDYAFPSFVEIPSYGQVQPVRPLLHTMINGSDSSLQSSFSSIRLKKIKEAWTDDNYLMSMEYWRADMIERTKDGFGRIKDNIEMTVFVDKVFPSALDAFTSKG